MKSYYYCVGGLPFSLCLDDGMDADGLLPSFVPFKCDRVKADEELFRMCVQPASDEKSGEGVEGTLLDEMTSDMGLTRLYAIEGGYRIVLNAVRGGKPHGLYASPDFMLANAVISWDDPYAGGVLCSMLRMVYSLAVVRKDGVSIHASAVFLDGYAYLFLGKSGTGKSTHAALWMRHFGGCGLLNDDNPVIRVKGEVAYAYGTPWSGKTPCYKNLCYPVRGIVRLRQAPANSFVLCTGIEAFVALLPGCSAIRQDAGMYNALCDTLVRLAGLVRVGVLQCLPDEEAAALCFKSIG